jgi:hypothetical protein
LDVEALTKQNGVRLLGNFLKKFKKKVKTDLPYLGFYKKKPETHIFFWGLMGVNLQRPWVRGWMEMLSHGSLQSVIWG